MSKKENGWSRFRRMYTNYYFSELSKSIKDKSKLKAIVKARMRKDYDAGNFGELKAKKKSKNKSRKTKEEKPLSTFSDIASYKWIKKTQTKLTIRATKEEMFVRNYLESKNINFEFQYDFQIEGHFFFPDFYFVGKYAILEIDGGYHNSKEQRIRDSIRDKFFRKVGVETYRITNEDAMDTNKLDSVLKMILSRNSPIVTDEKTYSNAYSNNRNMDNEFLSIVSS